MKAQNKVAVFLSQLLKKEQMGPQSEGGLVPDYHWPTAQQQLARHGFMVTPPFVVEPNNNKRIFTNGYLMLLDMSPTDTMANPEKARREILKATNYASLELGADIIGLGSLTTSITDGGKVVVDECGDKLQITHGDTGSTAMLWNLLEHHLHLDKDESVAVIGATGLIGTAISKLLNEHGNPLILNGRNPRKLDDLGQKLLKGNFRLVTDLAAIKEADLIITVTSSEKALLTPDMVKWGARVVDPAAPSNVKNHDGWTKNGNIVVSNACQVRFPGASFTSEMFGTTKEPDDVPTTYACVAETMLIGAVQPKFAHGQHLIGEISIDKVKSMIGLYQEFCVKHATVRMFGEDIGFICRPLPPQSEAA